MVTLTDEAQASLRAVWEEGASPAASSLLALYGDAVRKFKHHEFLGYWISDTLYPLGAWKTIRLFRLKSGVVANTNTNTNTNTRLKSGVVAK